VKQNDFVSFTAHTFWLSYVDVRYNLDHFASHRSVPDEESSAAAAAVVVAAAAVVVAAAAVAAAAAVVGDDLAEAPGLHVVAAEVADRSLSLPACGVGAPHTDCVASSAAPVLELASHAVVVAAAVKVHLVGVARVEEGVVGLASYTEPSQ